MKRKMRPYQRRKPLKGRLPIPEEQVPDLGPLMYEIVRPRKRWLSSGHILELYETWIGPAPAIAPCAMAKALQDAGIITLGEGRRP